MTATAIRDPDKLNETDEIEEAATRIAERHGDLPWQIGEEARQLEIAYGGSTIERFAAALAERDVAIAARTIRDYMATCAAFPEFGERSPNLSYRHHFIVRDRPDRFDLLVRTELEHLTTRQLQAEVNDLLAAEREEERQTNKKKPEDETTEEEETEASANANEQKPKRQRADTQAARAVAERLIADDPYSAWQDWRKYGNKASTRWPEMGTHRDTVVDLDGIFTTRALLTKVRRQVRDLMKTDQQNLAAIEEQLKAL